MYIVILVINTHRRHTDAKMSNEWEEPGKAGYGSPYETVWVSVIGQEPSQESAVHKIFPRIIKYHIYLITCLIVANGEAKNEIDKPAPKIGNIKI